jgi:hypothetical protein
MGHLPTLAFRGSIALKNFMLLIPSDEIFVVAHSLRIKASLQMRREFSVLWRED